MTMDRAFLATVSDSLPVFLLAVEVQLETILTWILGERAHHLRCGAADCTPIVLTAFPITSAMSDRISLG